MNQYIYTRAYGLQPLISGFNYRVVTQAGGKNVGQFLKPNISAGNVEVITEKSFLVNKFFGLDQIIVEKKGEAVFSEPLFDFNRFKIKVSGVPYYPFPRNSINIYDRPAITRILGVFLNSRIQEAQDLFYNYIAGQENARQTVYASMSFLELVFEFGDDIWKFIDQVKNVNTLPPTYSDPTTTTTSGTGATILQNTSKTITQTTITATSGTQTVIKNKYLLPIGVLAFLYVAKKKKWL